MEWVISRFAERYKCTPSVACRELGYRPMAPWIGTHIMELEALADIHRRHTAEKPDRKSIGVDYPSLYEDYLLATAGGIKVG